MEKLNQDNSKKDSIIADELSPKQRIRIEEYRVLETAKLLKGGAIFEFNRSDVMSLRITPEQEKEIHEEMEMSIIGNSHMTAIEKNLSLTRESYMEMLDSFDFTNEMLLSILFNKGRELFYVGHGLADGRYGSYHGADGKLLSDTECEKLDLQYEKQLQLICSIVEQELMNKNGWTREQVEESYDKFSKKVYSGDNKE